MNSYSLGPKPPEQCSLPIYHMSAADIHHNRFSAASLFFLLGTFFTPLSVLGNR
jgi:hypothetical protein